MQVELGDLDVLRLADVSDADLIPDCIIEDTEEEDDFEEEEEEEEVEDEDYAMPIAPLAPIAPIHYIMHFASVLSRVCSFAMPRARVRQKRSMPWG